MINEPNYLDQNLNLKTKLGEIYSAAMEEGNYSLAFKVLQFFMTFEAKFAKNTNFKDKKFSTKELEEILESLENFNAL